MSSMRQTQHGFSLIEVLIAMLIAGFALISLGVGQLKSLQYATNSYHYTVALIQANNSIERVWNDICQLQDARQDFDQAYINGLKPDSAAYVMTLDRVTVNNFGNRFTVNVSWSDERMTDGLDNNVSINATYPQFSAGCDADA